ncbi:MAG TPA: 4a-hydroxytetrahydrobiopterin dehydratase [Vicinamibacterales bacterium]|nr:4a-hydroxytetrahydrobiopterin dehydratase [Vicinamibacterales bacterium]
MKLASDQIREKLEHLRDWAVDGEAIRRQYTFDGFASAVAFVVRVGFDAEAADHHPDILISNYKKVTLTFTTHSAGGLTEKDFAAAEAADRVFAPRATARATPEPPAT